MGRPFPSEPDPTTTRALKHELSHVACASHAEWRSVRPMRGWWQLGWAWVALCYGCNTSASEPSLQAAVAAPETQPAQCSPSRRAAIQDRAGFVEALRTLQGCEWSALTPRAIANAVVRTCTRASRVRAGSSTRTASCSQSAPTHRVRTRPPAGFAFIPSSEPRGDDGADRSAHRLRRAATGQGHYGDLRAGRWQLRGDQAVRELQDAEARGSGQLLTASAPRGAETLRSTTVSHTRPAGADA